MHLGHSEGQNTTEGGTENKYSLESEWIRRRWATYPRTPVLVRHKGPKIDVSTRAFGGAAHLAGYLISGSSSSIGINHLRQAMRKFEKLERGKRTNCMGREGEGFFKAKSHWLTLPNVELPLQGIYYVPELHHREDMNCGQMTSQTKDLPDAKLRCR